MQSNVMTSVGWFLLALELLNLDTNAAFQAPNGSYIAHARHLHDYLLKDYRTSIRPVGDSRKPVTVDLKLARFSIEDLDEIHQVFTLSGLLTKSWNDFGLSWNPEDFDNMDFVTVETSDIWTPDIYVYQSKDAYYYPPNHHMARISSNGQVLWILPINIKTHCYLDLSDFPFDEHICRVGFKAWGTHDKTINLTSPDVGKDSENLMSKASHENIEWKLVQVTAMRYQAQYSCCPDEVYPEFTYSFTIRRRSTFTTHLFIGPSAMLCLVTPVVFLLPPGSREKMIFGVGVLIANTILLGEFINYIPKVHPNLPFIAKYFVCNIVMTSLSLLISAIIIGFLDKSSSRLTGPHAFFRLIFLGPLATILRVKKEDLFSSEDISSDGVLEINPDGEVGTESTSEVDPGTEMKRRFMYNYMYIRNTARSEWRQLAIVFDRLFLILFYLILIILTLSFARYM